MNVTNDEPEVFPRVFVATTIFCFVCSPVSSLGNLIVMYGLYKHPVGKLRTPSLMLFLNLVVSDFLTGMVLGILFAADALLDVSGINDVVLDASVFVLGGLLVFASNTTITAILFDRLVAMVKPIRYKRTITTKTVKLLITGIWIASVLVSLLPLVISKWTFLLIFSHIHISLPLISLVSMSLIIFISIRKQRRELLKYIHGNNPRAMELTKQFHNKRMERDRRLTFTIILVMVFFCVACLPIFIGVHLVVYLRSCPSCHFSEYSQRAFHSLCYFSGRFLIFNTALDPFLLYWRIPKIREAVRATCFYPFLRRCAINDEQKKVGFDRKNSKNAIKLLSLTTISESSQTVGHLTVL
ncbi:adrenocorticotropic hormone receptor-like [Actinia tenebrosa]|uniref:Adrenocorticotropic hormone receptor-like n=1 Tax=Actinia tenebrosa TaxID=6105 RepID=A0A6P8IBQ5_ACTTE|nr:adrenocorticotropic hormone receptor-like [Actinia tenebrosa]